MTHKFALVVIFEVPDDTNPDGRWFHDTLTAIQDVAPQDYVRHAHAFSNDLAVQVEQLVTNLIPDTL